MYTKEILPRISKTYYHAVKEFLKDDIALNYRLNDLSYEFIINAKRYFKVKQIALLLGVSIRHIYRILAWQEDFTKGSRINKLVYNWFASHDFDDFVKRCYEDAIDINNYERKIYL